MSYTIYLAFKSPDPTRVVAIILRMFIILRLATEQELGNVGRRQSS